LPLASNGVDVDHVLSVYLFAAPSHELMRELDAISGRKLS
jgi:hypothetical protein